MAFLHESDDQTNTRLRTGRIVAILSIAWWIASIGGIIYVINATA